MFVCRCCKVLLDDTQLKGNRCPIVADHSAYTYPLLRVPKDLSKQILTCIQKGYSVVSVAGGERNYIENKTTILDRFAPQIPHMTLCFYDYTTCVDFYNKIQHLTPMMQDWSVEGLHRFYRIDSDLHLVNSHILEVTGLDCQCPSDAVEKKYYIRFIGGGTKFSPSIIWENTHPKALTEDQQLVREKLLLDFYENYHNYTKEFSELFTHF